MAIPKIDMSKLDAQKIIDSKDDFWGKHNLTTRFIVLSSTILLIVLTLLPIFVTKDINHFEVMYKTISDMVLYVTLAIILGVNGLSKVLKIIKGV